ncbi:MAG: hypothetical protein FJY92_08240, partial [Candidatus Hydrogenedentes bacterium]|nr:hypothetical protein [Candidatus Hydrogenedentota bacterium]
MDAEEGDGVMAAAAPRENGPSVNSRLGAMAVAVVAASAVLCLRLWQLQIVEGADYANKAENNRLQHEVLKSPRGVIYGRDMNTVLADNRAACDLVMTPALLDDVDAVARTWEAAAVAAGDRRGWRLLCAINDTLARGGPIGSIAEFAATDADRESFVALLGPLEKVRAMCGELGRITGIDGDRQFARILGAVRKKTPFEQLLVKEDISKTERMRLEEYSFRFPGVYTVARPQRRYYYGGTGGQILGWFNEISPAEYEKLRPRYKLGDIVGRDGIEQAYEDALKGTDG